MHRVILEYFAAELRQSETLYVAPQNGGRLFASEAAADAWADSAGPPTARGAPTHLRRAYARANARRVAITVPRSVKGRPVVVAAADPPDASARPRFVLTMSRPGFSARGDTAIIFASHICGPLCGTSAMLLTVRSNRGWAVERMLWSVYH